MTQTTKRVGIFIVTVLLLIAGVLAYFQLFYQPKKVNSGLVIIDKVFKEHTSVVTAVRFSPNDSVMITGSVDSTIRIWERASGKVIKTIKQPQGITYLDISADGRFIVSASYDAVVRIWSIDGVLLKALKGNNGTVWAVAFSNDGRWIAGSGDDKIVRVWSTATGELVRALAGHTRIVWAVKFSPDGTKLASCSFDGSFRLWNLANGTLLRNNTQHTATVVDVAFSNDGTMLASTSDDCTIRLWRMTDGSLLRTMQVPEHVQAVAFSPDDKLLMTGGRDKTLIGELVQNFMGDSEFNKGVSARLWEVHTGKLFQTFTYHANDVMDIAYSHNGEWIATASADKTVAIWKVNPGLR